MGFLLVSGLVFVHRDEVFTGLGREGAGRMTLFASQSNARTWDFRVCVVASIP